jgi:hypothetical protein
LVRAAYRAARSAGNVFAYCAGDVTTVERCISAAAKLRPTTQTRRRYIVARVTFPLCR